MEVKTGSADRFVAQPPKDLSSVLVFGPDAGLVRERAERLILSVVADLADPFRIADLDETLLERDGARLFDETAQIPMLGGRRVVRVRRAGNGLADLFESYLEDHAGDALLVVEAGELTKSSALRRVFEGDRKAFAVACYPDNERNLGDVIRDTLKESGLLIAPDALDDAISRLGSDRGVTRRELEKLALYAKGQSRVSLADVEAVLGDETEARMEAACDAAGSGDMKSLDLALERLGREDINAVAILRTAMAHFQRLLLLRTSVDRNEPIDPLLRRLRPPLHFAREASVKAQVQRWKQTSLDNALDLLLEAEALVKTTGVPAEAVCGRALFNVAAMVRNAA